MVHSLSISTFTTSHFISRLFQQHLQFFTRMFRVYTSGTAATRRDGSNRRAEVLLCFSQRSVASTPSRWRSVQLLPVTEHLDLNQSSGRVWGVPGWRSREERSGSSAENRKRLHQIHVSPSTCCINTSGSHTWDSLLSMTWYGTIR